MERSESSVQVYPNPTRGELNISAIMEEARDIDVKLYDLSGKLLFKDQKAGFEGSYQQRISLNSFAHGMYMLVVNIDGNVQTEKILFTR